MFNNPFRKPTFRRGNRDGRIHRSIPILHVRIPSMQSRPVPASAQTTYHWRKHIPRRHAHGGRVDSHVVCSNPKLDVWVQNIYMRQFADEERVLFSVRNVHSQSAFPLWARGFPIPIFEFCSCLLHTTVPQNGRFFYQEKYFPA